MTPFKQEQHANPLAIGQPPIVDPTMTDISPFELLTLGSGPPYLKYLHPLPLEMPTSTVLKIGKPQQKLKLLG